MFTGLITDIGSITAIETMPTGIRLQITTQFEKLTSGESIAVDGACLTVTQHELNYFWVELSTETLEKTIARNYKIQQKVNLERALMINDRLGGHFVSGHVDRIATVSEITPHNNFSTYVIDGFPKENQAFLIEKGSIAVNGVSLTLNDIAPSSITVMLVPHTLKKTNLSQLKINDSVNIEFDLLTKIVEKQTKKVSYEPI